MPQVSHAIGRLNAVERDVLTSLRAAVDAAESAVLPVSGDDAVRALATYLRDQGFDIRPPAAPFVSAEEFGVLTGLAMLQRSTGRPHPAWDDNISSFFQSFASVLVEKGAVLPYRAVTRELAVPRGSVAAGEGSSARLAPVPALNGPSARARAIAVLKAMPSPRMSDFASAGVCRQTLSLLCKEMILRRDVRGRYSLVSPSER